MFDERELKQFDRWRKARPTQDKHGVDSVENPLSEKLVNLNPRNWHLEGNQLIAETDQGRLVQMIPTDRILIGTDDKGLPIFKKLDVA